MKQSLLYRWRLLVILVVVSAVLSVLSPRFLTMTNLSNVFWAAAIVGIMSSGALYTIITGGIDLSVGSVAAFSSVTFGFLFVWHGISFMPSIIITLLLGSFIGYINGLLVTKFNVPPFIVTMAALSYVFGISMVISAGETIGILQPEIFLEIGLGKFLDIPIPVYIMLLCMLLSYWLLNHSVYGRKIIAVGGNRVAADLSGINSKKVIHVGYILSSFAAALSGIVLASMTQQAKATMAQDYQMDVITAIVLGGTSLAGGHGSVTGALFGTLLVGLIANGLNLMNVAAPYHPIIKGLIILIAIAFDSKVRSGIKISFRKNSKTQSLA